VSYGYIGSMRTRPGRRDEVVAILVDGAEGLREAGCVQYTVGVSADDEVTIWATEVWGTREQHDASLGFPAPRAAIERAMPLLTGEFTRVETDVRGGLGL
jgi:quinol monooxygenase YgiN